MTHTDGHGLTGRAVLRRDDEPRLVLTSAGRTRAFDSDAEAAICRSSALVDMEPYPGAGLAAGVGLGGPPRRREMPLVRSQ